MKDLPDYDSLAEEIFTPMFPGYAIEIMDRTRIRSGQLLDVGSGGGLLGFALMDQGDFEHVTFYDIDAKALEQGRSRAERKGYANSECSYVQGDACSLDCFADESFDLVVSRGSLQFWDDLSSAMREIYRVLRPCGCAYIGGGVGINYRQSQRIDNLLHEARPSDGRPGSFDMRPLDALRKNRHQRDSEMLALFHELNCSYTIMNTKDQGGWYMFRKDHDLNW